MWNSKCNTDKQTRRKLCSFWKGSLVWVCARLYFVVVVCYTWIEMQSTRWLSEDWHSIFVCFFLTFLSPFACVCVLLWLWSRCRARGGYQEIGTLTACWLRSVLPAEIGRTRPQSLPFPCFFIFLCLLFVCNAYFACICFDVHARHL